MRLRILLVALALGVGQLTFAQAAGEAECSGYGRCGTSAEPSNAASAPSISLPPAPSAPLHPKSTDECLALQSQLDRYNSQIERAHAACISRGAPDRPWADGERECNWSACQTLHSYLFNGGSVAGNQQVASCRTQALRYQARLAAEQQGIQTLGDALTSLITPIPSTPIDSQNELAEFEDQQAGQSVLGDDVASAPSPDAVAKNIMVSDQSDNKSVQSQLDAAADAAASDDSISARVDPKKQAAELAGSVSQYLKDAAEAWKPAEGLREFSGPVETSLDALRMAKTASVGEIPTTIEPLEKLADFVSNEQNVLSALAQKSDNDWLQQSGVNAFDRSTIPQAQAYLDGWSQKLNQVQQLIQNFVPLATSAKNVLANEGVNAVRMATAGTTLPALDSLALEQIISNLNYCSDQINTIQSRLKSARSVVY